MSHLRRLVRICVISDKCWNTKARSRIRLKIASSGAVYVVVPRPRPTATRLMHAVTRELLSDLRLYRLCRREIGIAAGVVALA